MLDIGLQNKACIKNLLMVTSQEQLPPFKSSSDSRNCHFTEYLFHLRLIKLSTLHVCLGEICTLDSRLAMFWEETVLLAFCLLCFDCGAITLSASFCPFGVLERKVLGHYIDSRSVLLFLLSYCSC